MRALVDHPARVALTETRALEREPQLERELRTDGDVVERLLRERVHISDERIERAFPRMNRLERRALLSRRARLHRGRVVPIVAGASYGVAGGAYFRNAPPGVEGKDWRVDPPTFYRLTERNEQIVQTGRVWDMANPLDFPLPKVGILHELMLRFVGTMTITPGTGSFTQGWKWPFGIFGNVALQAGGESSLQYGWGTDFRTRQERLYRDPPTGSVAGAGAGNTWGYAIGTLASGANSIKTLLKVPVAHDLRTGMGSVYRQSDDLFLNLHLDVGALGELITLTGNATSVWTATTVDVVETYMTPERDDHGVIIVPEVRYLFETITQLQNFSANGTVRTPIPRLAGRLLAISHVLDQANGTVVAPSALSQIRFKYGANQQPITLIPDRVLEINRRNYNGTIGGGNYYALDGEVDNPERDPWVPTGFTEGAIEVDIPTSVTPAANSRSHLFMETMVRAL